LIKSQLLYQLSYGVFKEFYLFVTNKKTKLFKLAETIKI
jgi:hypothetical protein